MNVYRENATGHLRCAHFTTRAVQLPLPAVCRTSPHERTSNPLSTDSTALSRFHRLELAGSSKSHLCQLIPRAPGKPWHHSQRGAPSFPISHRLSPSEDQRHWRFLLIWTQKAEAVLYNISAREWTSQLGRPEADGRRPTRLIARYRSEQGCWAPAHVMPASPAHTVAALVSRRFRLARPSPRSTNCAAPQAAESRQCLS
jgi:hypothetical protein